jgi:hypothetical protein
LYCTAVEAQIALGRLSAEWVRTAEPIVVPATRQQIAVVLFITD